jgi:hypothetical protein
METSYRLTVFVGMILEFSDTAQIAVIKALDAKENTDGLCPG